MSKKSKIVFNFFPTTKMVTLFVMKILLLVLVAMVADLVVMLESVWSNSIEKKSGIYVTSNDG